MATTSSSISMSADGRCLEQGKATGDLAHDSRLMSGTQELLGLLRIFGEGYRLSCLYRCQVCQSMLQKNESFIKLPSNSFDLSRRRWKFTLNFRKSNSILDGCYPRCFSLI